MVITIIWITSDIKSCCSNIYLVQSVFYVFDIKKSDKNIQYPTSQERQKLTEDIINQIGINTAWEHRAKATSANDCEIISRLPVGINIITLTSNSEATVTATATKKSNTAITVSPIYI